MKRKPLVVLLIAALLVAGVISYFASTRPDGLEYNLPGTPSAQAQSTAPFPSPFPDYQVPNVPSPFVANGIAGIIGVLASFVAIYVVARLLSHSRRREP